jgi:hypothetical protein
MWSSCFGIPQTAILKEGSKTRQACFILFFYSKLRKIQGASLKTLVIAGLFFEKTGKIFKCGATDFGSNN